MVISDQSHADIKKACDLRKRYSNRVSHRNWVTVGEKEGSHGKANPHRSFGSQGMLYDICNNFQSSCMYMAYI